jgi:hypothetical protein
MPAGPDPEVNVPAEPEVMGPGPAGRSAAAGANHDPLSTLRNLGIPQPIYESTRGLWPHYKSDALGVTPERVSNQEPQDSRPCV